MDKSYVHACKVKSKLIKNDRVSIDNFLITFDIMTSFLKIEFLKDFQDFD